MKLYMKTNTYEEKFIKDKVLLIPKNGSNCTEGFMLQDSSKVIWEYLYKPRSQHEVELFIKKTYKGDHNFKKDIVDFLISSISLNCIKSVDNVKLELLDENHAEEFANILSNDTKLRKNLNINGIITKDSFYNNTYKWKEKTNSNCFSIIFNKKPIGLISLSHIKGISANIGYWIASDYWNMGLCTRAFKKVLEIAKDINLQFIGSTIEKDNIYSIKIWEHYPIQVKLQDEKYKINLKLEDIKDV